MLHKEELMKIAEYIIDCETGEYENYIEYCSDLGIDPSDITGNEQKTHVYARALIGLGLSFPND